MRLWAREKVFLRRVDVEEGFQSNTGVATRLGYKIQYRELLDWTLDSTLNDQCKLVNQNHQLPRT